MKQLVTVRSFTEFLKKCKMVTWILLYCIFLIITFVSYRKRSQAILTLDLSTWTHLKFGRYSLLWITSRVARSYIVPLLSISQVCGVNLMRHFIIISEFIGSIATYKCSYTSHENGKYWSTDIPKMTIKKDNSYLYMWKGLWKVCGPN